MGGTCLTMLAGCFSNFGKFVLDKAMPTAICVSDAPGWSRGPAAAAPQRLSITLTPPTSPTLLPTRPACPHSGLHPKIYL